MRRIRRRREGIKKAAQVAGPTGPCAVDVGVLCFLVACCIRAWCSHSGRRVDYHLMDADSRQRSHEHLAPMAFLVLRSEFFDSGGAPIPFHLRDKRNTQDDPLDEHIAAVLDRSLPDAACIRAPGPLITPDMVIARPDRCASVTRSALRSAPERIMGLEVKKLERTASGGVARASGLDYNTTPPCGTVRVYDERQVPVDIPGFYLFVCLEAAPTDGGKVLLSAMVFCDGNLLNRDFDLYLSIIGQREKEIGLGTYGDGVDRKRPMLIFANPLGASGLDHAASLIMPEDVNLELEQLRPAYRIVRTIEGAQEQVAFTAYRLMTDLDADCEVRELVDPFPTPAERQTTTQRRGRFLLPFSPSPNADGSVAG